LILNLSPAWRMPAEAPFAGGRWQVLRA